MSKKGTPEEIQRAIELRLEGYTLEEAAEILGRSAAWVRDHTKDIHTKGKAKNLSLKKIVSEHNKKQKEIKKQNRKLFCIPVVFLGYNSA